MEKKKTKNLQKLRFKGGSRDQIMLPSYLDEWIAKDHPVRLIDAIVDEMDLSDILATYRPGGAPLYHPRVLLKILFYGYLSGDTSTRTLEVLCCESMPYMWLTGMQQPDHVTIGNFRSSKLQSSIDSLFNQVVRRLYDEHLVNLKTQTVDGTKIESVSNRYRYVWRKVVERHKGNLEEKIKGLIAEIDEDIAVKEAAASTSVEDVVKSEQVKKKLDQLKKKSTSVDKKLASKLKELDKCVAKLAEYEGKIEILGARNSYSKTDEDATFMRMKEDHHGKGQPKPGYNVQASSENTFITQISVHQNANDGTCFKEHTESALDMLEKIGLPAFERSNGDAGYGNSENYAYLASKSIDPYLQYSSFYAENTGKQAKQKFNSRNWPYNAVGDYYTCPVNEKLFFDHQQTRTTRSGYERHVKIYQAENCNSCSFADQCLRKNKDHIQGQALPNRTVSRDEVLLAYQQKARDNLKSDLGKNLRRLRGCEIETVFGDIKSNYKFRRFTHITLPKVKVELKLYAIGYNLRKLSRILRKKAA